MGPGSALIPPQGCRREAFQGSTTALDFRGVRPAAVLCTATAITLVHPRRGVRPFRGRLLKIVSGSV
ncbi:hypothetical protein [Streptomyces sp. NPDC004589]|uniref:hypothetical protein n=1 Tax=Streptomyces sp. NPDC004589 TaxID=3154553 RepID=UPI0033B67AA5